MLGNKNLRVKHRVLVKNGRWNTLPSNAQLSQLKELILNSQGHENSRGDKSHDVLKAGKPMGGEEGMTLILGKEAWAAGFRVEMGSGVGCLRPGEAVGACKSGMTVMWPRGLPGLWFGWGGGTICLNKDDDKYGRRATGGHHSSVSGGRRPAWGHFRPYKNLSHNRCSYFGDWLFVTVMNEGHLESP